MLLNYLKLSLRLLARNPFFTGINVIGLAIGFASFYALWEFSTTELQSDQFHKDYERIVRVGLNWRWTDDGGKTWGHIAIGPQRTYIADLATLDQPDIESSVRIMNASIFSGSSGVDHGNEVLISIEDTQTRPSLFKEKKVAYADANLFTFFTIPLIYGQPDQVLSEAGFVVLSQSKAVKYFGERNPIGELLKLNDTTTLKVTGVFADLPHNSHLNFDIVISNRNLLTRWSDRTGFAWAHWYVRLREGAQLNSLETNLNNRMNDYYVETLRGFPMAKLDFLVQPLKEVAFSQSFNYDDFYPKSRTFLFTLAFIGLSVLLMALVNYVNLSVTRTTRRLKEVATRKVSGAGASDMMKQFITEAAVVNVFALCVAFTLVQLIRSPMSFLFNIHIADFSSLSNLTIVIFLVIVIAGILLSGLYPAMISIAHHPRALFRISISSSDKRIVPSLLTISQFAAALVFILFGFVVSLQLNHILNMETGIKKEEIVIVDAPIVKSKNFSQDFEALKKQISLQPDLTTPSSSSAIAGDKWDEHVLHIKRVGAELFFGMDNAAVDENFIPLYEVQLIGGRNFLPDDRADAVILSRFATERLGFKNPEDAIGATVNLNQKTDGNWIDVEVIGVFEDFRVVPLLNMSDASSEYSNEGRGIIFLYKNKLFPDFTAKKIGLKLNTVKIDEAMKAIESMYHQQFPENIFNWYFLDEHTNQAYGNEKIARNQIILFTGLAILIACMGLLGMISYKAVEKTKEIGIRKTLGARNTHIGNLLLNTTLKQMMVSVLIGLPLAYYLIQEYFKKFADHITLQWWHFAVPVVILVLIMLATVASVLYKAARSNPVEALKYE